MSRLTICRNLFYWATRIALSVMMVWIVYRSVVGWKPPEWGSTAYSLNILNKIPREDASAANLRSWLKDLTMGKVTHADHHFWMKYLRMTDKPVVEEALNIEVSHLSGEEVVKKYHELISKPLQGVCRNLKRFGGNWWTDNNSLDGDRFVCLDDSRIWDGTGNCLVYSFGIADDWSFEDSMEVLGCKVFAHDPTVDYPATRGENIRFHKLGLSANSGFNHKFGFPVETLQRIIFKNNHSKTVINYLKVDIEGSELSSMLRWLSSGALDNIQQIGMEIHLNGVPNSSLWCSWIGPVLVKLAGYQESEVLCWYQEMLVALQLFYTAGFRLISSTKTIIPGKIGISENPYTLRMFNVVFMRDNIWNCLEADGEGMCTIKH